MSVAIYNLTTDNADGWGSVFTYNSRPYGVSRPIYDVIGGSSGGNATTLKPAGGWSNASVAKLFTGTTDLNANAKITGFATKSSKKGLSGGAIAGIVIGCVVAVLIVLALVFLYLRKKKRQKKEEEEKGRVERANSGGLYDKPELETTESRKLKEMAEAQRHEMAGSQVEAEVDGTPRVEAWAFDAPLEMEGSIPPSTPHLRDSVQETPISYVRQSNRGSSAL